MATKRKSRKSAKQATPEKEQATLAPKMSKLAAALGSKCAQTDAAILKEVEPLVKAYKRMDKALQKLTFNTFAVAFMGADKKAPRTKAQAEKILAKQRAGSKPKKGVATRNAAEQGNYYRAYSKFRFYIIQGGEAVKVGGGAKLSKAQRKKSKAESFLSIMGGDLQAAIAFLRRIAKD